ncbi:hypothetical protein KR51_00034870 [Rubidibacter lacunae KORDI 51-2]|uniref:Uncharacterized protein n=1 Tax=Rubidibacter lacunae KORDI 51-2 TaxID=582515 RepID=U5DEF5_9CHRO|nr:hypothetical protein [Rubidibacter lacunae]ERN40001.1 hypothetical protein KR51_00034870 [Rubidibacter lacunae KORDI 51-2]
MVSSNLQEAAKLAAAVHRDSLRKNIQHRLTIARNEGNERLVRQLEAEANYLRLG